MEFQKYESGESQGNKSYIDDRFPGLSMLSLSLQIKSFMKK